MRIGPGRRGSRWPAAASSDGFPTPSWTTATGQVTPGRAPAWIGDLPAAAAPRVSLRRLYGTAPSDVDAFGEDQPDRGPTGAEACVGRPGAPDRGAGSGCGQRGWCARLSGSRARQQLVATVAGCLHAGDDVEPGTYSCHACAAHMPVQDPSRPLPRARTGAACMRPRRASGAQSRMRLTSACPDYAVRSALPHRSRRPAPAGTSSGSLDPGQVRGTRRGPNPHRGGSI